MLKYAVIVLAAFIIAILTVGKMPPLISITILIIGAVYFVKRKVQGEMRKKIITLFLIAFLLQVAISLFLYNQTIETKYRGFFYKGDDYTYADFGMEIARLWRAGIFPSLEKLDDYGIANKTRPLLHNYQFYNAFIFYLFGTYGSQILLILNCFFHAALIIPAYFICKGLNIKNNVMWSAFFLLLFWPSTFFWSLFNLKEAPLLFFTLTLIILTMRLSERLGIKNIIFVGASLFSIYCVKPHLFIASALMVFFYFLIFYRRPYKKITVFILSFLFILKRLGKPPFPGLRVMLNRFSSEAFHIRAPGKLSNTPYFTSLVSNTPLRLLLYFPLGLLAALFLPFLLRPSALTHVMANIESIIWWCLLPFLIKGMRVCLKSELKNTFPILFIWISWLCVLAITQGNMGTLLRQKSVIYCLGFILISLGIDRTLGHERFTR